MTSAVGDSHLPESVLWMVTLQRTKIYQSIKVKPSHHLHIVLVHLYKRNDFN
jgi:hypothetical protein